MATTAVFYRHPQTLDNIIGIITGQMDVPVTRDGKRKATGLLGNGFQKPGAIITGPLQRQVFFARLAAKKFGLEYRVDERLLEMHCGKFTGMHESRAQLLYPDCFFRMDGKITAYLRSTPGGESWDGIMARVKDFLHGLKSGYSGLSVIVITSLMPFAAAKSIIHGTEAPAVFSPHIKNLDSEKFEI